MRSTRGRDTRNVPPPWKREWSPSAPITHGARERAGSYAVSGRAVTFGVRAAASKRNASKRSRRTTMPGPAGKSASATTPPGET